VANLQRHPPPMSSAGSGSSVDGLRWGAGADVLANEGQGSGNTTPPQRRKRGKRGSVVHSAPLVQQSSQSSRQMPVDVEDAFAMELTTQINTGGQAFDDVVSLLHTPGLLRRLSFERVGCRTVQAAFDSVDGNVAAELALGLSGSVVEATYSRHANYVLQQIIKVLSPQQAQFIVEEIANSGNVSSISCHEYGCRIICRLLESSGGFPGTVRLVDTILQDIDTHLTLTYGHYVIQSILEHGAQHQRDYVMSKLQSDVMRYASNRSGAHVVQKALASGSDDDQQALANRLLTCTTEESILLASSQAGLGIVRLLMKMEEPIPQRTLEHFGLDAVQSKVLKGKQGRSSFGRQGASGRPRSCS